MNDTLSPADGDKIPGLGTLKTTVRVWSWDWLWSYLCWKTALFSLNPNQDETVHKYINDMSLTGRQWTILSGSKLVMEQINQIIPRTISLPHATHRDTCPQGLGYKQTNIFFYPICIWNLKSTSQQNIFFCRSPCKDIFEDIPIWLCKISLETYPVWMSLQARLNHFKRTSLASLKLSVKFCFL